MAYRRALFAPETLDACSVPPFPKDSHRPQCCKSLQVFTRFVEPPEYTSHFVRGNAGPTGPYLHLEEGVVSVQSEHDTIDQMKKGDSIEPVHRKIELSEEKAKDPRDNTSIIPWQ